MPLITHHLAEKFKRISCRTGLMLNPTVRRTYAPRGETPILKSWDRRDRISALGAITVSPKQQRLNLGSSETRVRHKVHGGVNGS
jgi:hypothetical protein